MKLKARHFEIAKTISYFVDRILHIGYPEFVEPTTEQIRLFFTIESRGIKNLTKEEVDLVSPMLNGKENYDLTIKMLHEELAEWISNGWGWHPPLMSAIEGCGKDSERLKTYIDALLKIKDNIEKTSGFDVVMNYSGFSEDFKENFRLKYFQLYSAYL